jgi:hypothetical protein
MNLREFFVFVEVFGGVYIITYECVKQVKRDFFVQESLHSQCMEIKKTLIKVVMASNGFYDH